MSDELTPSDSTVDQAAAGAAPSLANPSRRYLLRAAGVGGAVVAVGAAAAACSSSSNGTPSNPVQASSAGGDPASSAAAGTTDSSSAAAAGGGNGAALYATSQIPLNGGMINANADGGIVVTQPSSGVYKAFSSTCTHLGCTVGSVSDNKIMCPCHGSEYSAVDGSVINGPAPKPLPAKNITVSGGSIFPA